MNVVAFEAGFALGMFALLVTAFAIGRRLGKRHPDEHPQLGVVQGATLGMMGLLLGFSFSGAMTRMAGREELLVRHANALGTMHLRTQLAGAQRESMQTTVREYASVVLQAFDRPGTEAAKAAQARLTDLEARLWSDVTMQATAQPAQAMLFVPVANELIDVRAARIAATQRHLPALVLAVLLVCASLSVGTIGYGMAGGRKSLIPPAIALIGLMAAVLWVVIDLDYPRYGLIHISDAPMEAAVRAITGG